MAETNRITFTHKEVVEALIRNNDLHEGLWQLYVEFGLSAANVGPAPGQDVNPAAIIPIVKLGLQKVNEPSNIAADAAMVNPAKARSSKSR
jgi:hypothetical protein